MKFTRWDGQHLVFEISAREKRLLFELLRLYPLIPPAHHALSRTADPEELGADAKLLEDALNEQRSENRRQLEAMLQEKNRFQQIKDGFRLSLTAPQVEWLLQVLNDIRVGSWLILGEPDERQGRFVDLTEDNAKYLWAMDLSALLQMTLIDALKRPEET